MQVNATSGKDMEYIFSHRTSAGSTGYTDDPWGANQVIAASAGACCAVLCVLCCPTPPGALLCCSSADSVFLSWGHELSKSSCEAS